ncbi:hypothetical protein P4S60_10335 [Pseudoalteromonas sp. Hal040]|uniref:hypothetical protein n=2 Tax=unclassified Pseudoalteromonas TaxID=194690 RepID=UPI00301D98F1
MAQVNVYRWDDEGAPQIVEGRPSEFINVLKKCLVDGYGTKSAAGWSVAHESLPEESPYIAIRNSEVDGSGGVFTVQQGNNNANNTVRFQGALDYISKTSYARLTQYFYSYIGGTSQTYPNNWIILATSTAFYVMCFPEARMSTNYFGTYNHCFTFIGDIKSFFPNDPAKFVALSGYINNTAAGWNSQLNYVLGDSATQQIGYVYSLDGTESKANCYACCGLGLWNVSQNSIQDSEPEIRVLSQFILSTGSYQLASAGTQGNNETLPFARGFIPGLFSSQENGYRNASMPFIKEIEGVSYLSIPRSNAGGSNIWVNIEEW